jgi:hypothetical protein
MRDEGVVEFQLSHVIIGGWCRGKRQEHFVHNIVGGLVIDNERNHGEHRLNLFADPA